MTIKPRRIAATIYKTYICLGRDIPYFRAMLTIVFLLFIHVAQIVIVFNLPSYYLIPADSPNKTIRWLEGFAFFSILIGICALIFPKKKLDEQQISETTILRAKRILPWYFAGTIFLLTILLVLHGIRKGTIHF